MPRVPVSGRAPASRRIATNTPLFFYDTFTDVDNTPLQNHVSNSGVNWIVHPLNTVPQLEVQMNGVRKSQGGGALVGIYYANVPTVPVNQIIEANIRILNPDIAASPGIFARLDTVQRTGYLFRLNVGIGSSSVELFVYNNNVATSLGVFSVTVTTNSIYAMKLEAIGSSIVGYWNGVAVISVTNSVVASPGKPGIQVSGANSGGANGRRLDDFRALSYLSSSTRVPAVGRILIT